MFLRQSPYPAWRRPAAGLADGALDTEAAHRGRGSAFPLIKMLEAYDPAFDPREPILTPVEMAVFVETFQATGFTGGVNWYRNFTRNWRRAEGITDQVKVPSLMVMAELDAVLPPSAADGMEAYVQDLEKTLIKDSGSLDAAKEEAGGGK